ncbi:MAG: hypothetical protein OZSIB_3013 [Candidatus Ozemobacter sibiricus]|uniref:DUF2325 domain-containing protein n=1 Tax=Candidatus Ozemobacter sibiricus TaxID=2268124 RepID=A0A367ZRN0_9BACT|nr:MAG: hypothetical protein OZSIB_3013 [Candidatus Ozemobacter sibiricus]
MADPYWDPIFARLQNDLDLLRLMAADLDDAVLLGCLGPNPSLQKQLGPFVKGRRVTNRPAFLEGLRRAAARDEALRQILFFSWITSNAATMKFPTVPADEAALARLRAGEFGPPAKIAILARIDPRPAAVALLNRFLDEGRAPAATDVSSGSLAQPPTDHEGPPSPKAEPASAAADARLADLERRLREALEEAKTLRRRLKEVEAERHTLQQRASQQGAELARRQEELANAVTTAARWQAEVERLTTAARAARPASEGHPTGPVPVHLEPAGPPPKRGEPPASSGGDREREELRRRVASLEEAVNRRAAAIERLEHDLAEARERAAHREEQTEQIERLQQRVAEQAAELRAWRQGILGRVVARTREGGRGGVVCLVELPGGGLVRVPERRFQPCPPLEGEWVVVGRMGGAGELRTDRAPLPGRQLPRERLGTDGQAEQALPGDGSSRPSQLDQASEAVVESGAAPASEIQDQGVAALRSIDPNVPTPASSDGSDFVSLNWGWTLEANQRIERIGILVRREGEWFLEGDEETWPVAVSLDQADEGRPAVGIWLPALGERPAAVRAVRWLSTREVPPPQTFASWSTLERFWRLLPFAPEEMARFLRETGVACTIQSDGVSFERDVRAVLGGLRGRLPLGHVCERPACRETARGRPGFWRAAGPDDRCDVCGAVDGGAEPAPAEIYDFGGLRVVIVGGDAVGARYVEALASHRLQVEWHSGFAGLGPLREGLGGAAAVVIVLRQVSHTVVRELLLVAQAAGVPVLFSPVRGVSGVLRVLVEFLRPTRC